MTTVSNGNTDQCTREKGHNWRVNDHDQDHCPFHTSQYEAERIANALHHVLNVQVARSYHNDIAHCQAPLYRAVQAATMAAFTLVTGSEQDAKELRDLMLDDSGEGIWWWLNVLADKKRDRANEAAEHYAAVAADAQTDTEQEVNRAHD